MIIIKKSKFLFAFILIFLISSCEFFTTSSSNIISSISHSSEVSSYPASFKLENYNTLSNIYEGVMPPTGDVNILVIPIDFFDFQRNDVEVSLSDLNDVFFSKSEDIEWESVSSYYYKSSYEKLNIGGVVTPWYRAPKLSSYYENNGYESLFELFDYVMKEVSNEEWFNPSDFDSNNDGYYDGVYLYILFQFSIIIVLCGGLFLVNLKHQTIIRG